MSSRPIAMKSTGETMAIGRTIEESLMKALRSTEAGKCGLEPETWDGPALVEELERPTDKRIYAVAEALRRGHSVEEIAGLTKWDVFFIAKMKNIVKMEDDLKRSLASKEVIGEAKKMGFGDEYISILTGKTEESIRKLSPRVTYKMVDTCGGEFEASTPYFYSTVETEDEVREIEKEKVLIVGGGPIRIGQGVEFDNCCVHGIMALREEGRGALIVNNNPETVSTDFDTSDRLYFEPLLLEDVLNIIRRERPEGVILQFGGQTSVNLALPLEEAIAAEGLKTRILGTSPESIDIAEDRRKFEKLMGKLGIRQAEAATGFSFEEVRELAAKIGYPVLVRPSYVLGGRGMEIVHNEEELEHYMRNAAIISKNHPVLVDKYLSHAIEIDVDAVSDGKDVFIGGIQEHIEEAGVHSGDAVCVLPSQTLPETVLERIRKVTHQICHELKIVGLVNLQLAVKEGEVYVLEANPRASRTVPYVSKAIGVPLAKVATKVMLGYKLRDLGLIGESKIRHVAVKAPVFPFQKLPGVDAILGPEMKSTGEVMGIDSSLGAAYYKAMVASGNSLPMEGAVYATINDQDKEKFVPIAKKLTEAGLKIYATKGTSAYLKEYGVEVSTVYRIAENRPPDALGLMRAGEIKLVINTPTVSSGARRDGYMMRRLAIDLGIPFITTIQGAKAAADAIEAVKRAELSVRSLQEYAKETRTIRSGSSPTVHSKHYLNPPP